MEYHVLTNPNDWIKSINICFINNHYCTHYTTIYSGDSKTLAGSKTLRGAKQAIAIHLMKGAKWKIENY